MVAVAIVLVCWGAWALLKPEPETVVVGTVVQGPMRVYVRADGTTRMRERVVIYAPSSGEVSRISLVPGDSIARGQSVARLAAPPAALLDPRTRAELEARALAASDGVGQTQQALARAEAALRLRESELERAELLVERGIGTASDVETAQFGLQAAHTEVSSARFAVRVARHSREQIDATMNLDESAERTTLTIDSPIDGLVLSVLQQSAGMVAPGTPLMEIGDPNSMEVVIDVLTADAVGLRTGGRVILTRWGGTDALLGRIARIEPLAFTRISALGVEEQRVNVVANLDSLPTPPERIGDGWRVEAALLAWQADNVVQVPLNAVFRDGDGWSVWTVQGDQLSMTSVELGQRDGRVAEVTSGLRAGELVVMHPSEVLEPGATVIAVADDTPAPLATNHMTDAPSSPAEGSSETMREGAAPE
jgi:HlyD family secretion protein